MKLFLLIVFCSIFTACPADNKTVNPGNQKPVNVNANPSNLNQNPAVSNTSKTTPDVGGKTAAIGETITLKGGESGTIKDTGLTLKAVSVGSASLPSPTQNSQPGASIPFCRVEAALNGKTEGQQLYMRSGKTDLIFEGFKIQIRNVVPTGDVSCSFIVTKIGK